MTHKAGRLLLAFVLALSCMGLGSCKFSETITETVYDQSAENIDYDNETKLLTNTIDAEETSNDLPELAVSDDSDPDANFVIEVPVYGGTEEGTPVPQVYFDSEGSEDSAKVAVQEPEETDSEEETEQEEGVADDPESDSSSNPEGGDGTAEDDDADDGPENQGDDLTDAGSGKNANNEIKEYHGEGEFAEIPEDITRVTAVGQAAVIVSMLGGEAGALVGADEEFTQNSAVQTVLANKGVSEVATLWSGDGSEEGSLIDMDALLAADPQLCYVISGDDTLSDEEIETLLANNILVYYLPNMNSAGAICSAVEIVGQTLEAGGNAQAGELYRSYLADHDALVSEIISLNGGITGGYNYDTAQSVDTSATTRYTLYISDWDYSAVYSDTNGYLSSASGVGISELGSAWSPLAYYMSVGGAINNASAGTFSYRDGYTGLVWQFSQTMLPCSFSRWSALDLEKVNYNMSSGNGLDESLTWVSSGRVEATGATSGYGLGTENFPAVIVKTQEMKEAMEADMVRENGLYHPYGTATSSQGGVVNISVVGFYTGTNLCEASIGAIGGLATSVLNDGTTVNYYDILVNPCGLFESWTDGSVESYLECAWIYQQFVDPSYDVDSLIIDFYQTYFNYNLTASDLATIYAGASE